MINEHDLRDLYEENKDKQPKPPEEKPKSPNGGQLSFELEVTVDDEIAAILATIPFGR